MSLHCETTSCKHDLSSADWFQNVASCKYNHFTLTFAVWMYSNYELEYTSSLSKLTPRIRDNPQLSLLFLFCVVIDSEKRKIWYFYAFHEKLLLQLKWAKGNLPFILPTALFVHFRSRIPKSPVNRKVKNEWVSKWLYFITNNFLLDCCRI